MNIAVPGLAIENIEIISEIQNNCRIRKDLCKVIPSNLYLGTLYL